MNQIRDQVRYLNKKNGKKRLRQELTLKQLAYLDREFEKQNYAGFNRATLIGRAIGLSHKEVVQWFNSNRVNKNVHSDNPVWLKRASYKEKNVNKFVNSL